MNPFSHLPGTALLIPGSSFEVEVFPALVRIFDLASSQRVLVKEVPVAVQGPLKNFTVLQDIERGCVTVFAKGMRYHILPSLEIRHEKKTGLPLQVRERLFFGCHKKPEWQSLYKRGDFREIFPLWHALGSSLSLPPSTLKKGMFALLEEIEEETKPGKIVGHFQKLFLAGFRGMLVPRLFDDSFQGIVKEDSENVSPLYLLTKGATLIRALFISHDERGISFLPKLPPEFFCGRFTKGHTPFGTVDLEWTKKTVRTLEFTSAVTATLQMRFHSSLKTCRLRTGKEEKGERVNVKEMLSVQKGVHYRLDRFER